MPRLADIAMILSGASPERDKGDPVRFIQIRDLTLERRSSLFGERPTATRAVPVELTDLLFAGRGDQTLVVQPDQELVGAFATPDVYLIRPDLERVDPAYLAAFLRRPSVGAHLRASTAGASLPRVPKEALTEIDVPLPALSRQRSIGGLAVCMRHHATLAAQLHQAEARAFDRQLDRVFAELE